MSDIAASLVQCRLVWRLARRGVRYPGRRLHLEGDEGPGVTLRFFATSEFSVNRVAHDATWECTTPHLNITVIVGLD